MDVSGIVIACMPEHLAETKLSVNALAWAEVHHEDPRGRIVATIEAQSTKESEERLRQLQELPKVLSAQMAGYYPDLEEQS